MRISGGNGQRRSSPVVPNRAALILALILLIHGHPIRLTRPFHSAQAVAQVNPKITYGRALSPLPSGRFDNITYAALAALIDTGRPDS